jgi:hypothetical protein
MISDFEQKDGDFENIMRLEFLNYDKKRYLELLKKKSVNSQQSEEELSELLSYSALLEIQITWETRFLFLELLEQFVKGKISMDDFIVEFFDRDSLNSQTLSILESNLILFSPDEESLDFSNFIANIYWTCEQIGDSVDWSNEQIADSEEYKTIFRNSIEKYFLQIQNYLSKYN